MKQKITILVPAVQIAEVPSLVVSFANSEARKFLELEFVYLFNSKVPQEHPIIHGMFDGISVTKVFSDRYFATCEENIFRCQDFLCNDDDGYVLCVGEHDQIAWLELVKALNRMSSLDCDAMAVNVACLEKWEDGSSSMLPALAQISVSGPLGVSIHDLWNGHVLNSNIAFPALLSAYGPIDWAAYIGSHIFSKRSFRGVLQFRFVENIYSLVYMQMEYFSRAGIRYALYRECVIYRISDSFQMMIKGTHSWGWLSDHRLMAGRSPIFWLANLSSLSLIKDRNLSRVAMSSITLSVNMIKNQDLTYRRGSFILNSLNWISLLTSSANRNRRIDFGSNVFSYYWSDFRITFDYLIDLFSFFRECTIFDDRSPIYGVGDDMLTRLDNFLFKSENMEQFLASFNLDITRIKELCSNIDLLGVASIGFERYSKNLARQ